MILKVIMMKDDMKGRFRNILLEYLHAPEVQPHGTYIDQLYLKTSLLRLRRLQAYHLTAVRELLGQRLHRLLLHVARLRVKGPFLLHAPPYQHVAVLRPRYEGLEALVAHLPKGRPSLGKDAFRGLGEAGPGGEPQLRLVGGQKYLIGGSNGWALACQGSTKT